MVLVVSAAIVARRVARTPGENAPVRPRRASPINAVVVALLGVLIVVALPWWRPPDPLAGRQGLLSYAPSGLASAVAQHVAAHVCHLAVRGIARTDLDNQGRAAAHPVPALLRRLDLLGVQKRAQGLAEGAFAVQHRHQILAIFQDLGIFRLVAQHGHDHDLPPGHQRHDHGQRTDVENQDPQHHAIDRARQGFLRILGFGCGQADKLAAAERKEGNRQSGEKPRQSGGKKPAIVPDIGQGGMSAGEPDALIQKEDASQHHADDGDHLDQGHPKFRFPEPAHAQHIDAV